MRESFRSPLVWELSGDDAGVVEVGLVSWALAWAEAEAEVVVVVVVAVWALVALEAEVELHRDDRW